MKKALPTVTHISTVHTAFDVRIFHKECKSLAAHGMKVHFVVTHDKEETVDGVHILPLPSFKNRLSRMLFKPWVAFYKALQTRADIYHFHDPELIPFGILLKICGKKVIYDVHEDVPCQILNKHWIPKSLRSSVSWIFKGIEAVSARLFTGIVCATPHITHIFEKRNKHSININNYPLLSELPNLEKESSSRQDNVICYVGGITRERGIIELLDAIEETNIQLQLAGRVSPQSLIPILESHKGWKNVHFFGQRKRDEIVLLLRNARIGICTLHPTPSYLKSIPIKIFEYMSAGLPVIASDFSYWKELVGNIGSARFVDPLNPVDLRQAITTLLADEEKCQSMGKKGLQAVQEAYNWGNEEEKLIHFYHEIFLGQNA